MSNTPRLDDDQALELVQESVASKTPPEIANWDVRHGPLTLVILTRLMSGLQGCRFALVEVDDQLAEDCDNGKVRGSNGRGTAVRISELFSVATLLGFVSGLLTFGASQSLATS